MVLKRCIVAGCGKDSYSEPNLHFYHWPSAPEKLEVWALNMNVLHIIHLPFSTRHNLLICAEHFDEKCFKNKDAKKLNINAVPTILPAEKNEEISAPAPDSISDALPGPSSAPDCVSDALPGPSGCHIDAVSTILTAEKIVRNLNYTAKNVLTKSSDVDLVTETDQKVEKLLISGFSSEFPDHKFIGEETVADGGNCNLTDDPTWIIDPIDGTMNFVHGFPHSCISIALFINKEPHVAIVYNPVLEQMFTAQKGKGAFLNETQIKVSGQTELSKALVFMEGGICRDVAKMQYVFDNMQILMPLVQGSRALGSTAMDMAMIALGAVDAYYDAGTHIWDIAAGELLVKEAGGVVIDPSGGDLDRFSRRVLCASTQELAEKLAQKLVQYYPTPRD